MPVHCCVAPPAAGKTKACIEKIQTTLAANLFAEVWVIVPGSLQAVHFRRRLAEAGGAVGVTVGTFQNFAFTVLEKTTSSLPIAPVPFTNMVLNQVIDQASALGQIDHYASVKDFPGFITVLRDAFRELNFAFVSPQQFTSAALEEGKGTQELAVLYAAYTKKMEEIGWGDTSDVARKALREINARPGLLSKLRLVVVDGFDSFTKAEVAVLQGIASQVSELYITLPGDRHSSREAHKRAMEGLRNLENALPLRFVELDAKPFLPEMVDQIERTLFEQSSLTSAPPYAETFMARPYLIEVYSPEAEVREALRWLKARIVRDGLLPSDCVIFTADADQYEPAIRLAASEFGLPVHFFRRRAFATYPVGAALLNLINLPVDEYRTHPLFNFLRSPFFKTPLGDDRSMVDDLDDLSRYARITGGIEQWDELFGRLLKAETANQEEENWDYHRKNLPDKERVQRLKEAFNAILSTLIAFTDQQLTRAEWVASFEKTLGDLGFFELALVEAGEKILDSFFESLRALVLSESVLGEDRIDYPTFAHTITATITSLSLPEPVDHAPSGTILVGSFLEARAVRYKAVCIMGMSEGNYPVRERTDPFLSESIRTKLGLENQLERDQGSLFYQAVTRSDQFFLLTRAYLNEDGEKWEASPYWLNIVANLGKGIVKSINSKEQFPLEDAASEQEVLFHARGNLHPAFQSLRHHIPNLQHSSNLLRARKQPDQFDQYDGNLPSLTDALTSHFSPQYVWSASRIETFATCPYFFFSGSVLKLDDRLEPEEDYDAAQLGSIYHLILEKLFSKVEQKQDLDALQKELPIIAAEVFKNAPNKFGFRISPLWTVQQKEILRTLRKALTQLVGMSPNWWPTYFEHRFGFAGTSPLVVMEGNEKYLFRGSIDRIDVHQTTGNLRVIDYKSASSMNNKDFILQKKLQFVLYAMAVEDLFKLGKVSDSIYFSINAAMEIGPKMEVMTEESDSKKSEMFAAAKQTIGQFVTQIRAGEFIPKKPEDGCPSYCPASSWCWHYVPKEI